MGQAARDQNQVTTALGSFNGVATPLKVEHATGYLKVSLFNGTLNPPVVTPDEAQRDENQVTSALGSFNGTPKPLLVANSTGYLRVSLQ